MPPDSRESAVDRGRRVALERLSREGIEAITPVNAPSSPQKDTGLISQENAKKSLLSEIDTLKCIIDVKDKEIAILRLQLSESNRIIEKTRDVIQAESMMKSETENQPSQVGKLLHSFSDASSGTLRRVLSAVQNSTNVDAILELPKKIQQLADTQKKYHQLYKASCVYLRLRPGDISHSGLVEHLGKQGRATIHTGDGEVLKQAVRKNSGIAWTFK
jgi:hypothetical protein